MRIRQKGATLLEIFLASIMFTIIMLVLVAITNYAITSWKSIEDRVDIQTKIRKIEANLTADLMETSYSSVIVNTPASSEDAIYAVAFKTFKNPETGNFDTDESGLPVFHGYIIYMLVRPTDDPTKGLISSTPTDSISPYKSLVRIELTRTTDGTDTWDPLDLANEADPWIYIPTPRKLFRRNARDQNGVITPRVTKQEYENAITGDTKYVQNITLMASDVMTFNVKKRPNANYPEIQIDLRLLKINEAQKQITIGFDDLSNSKYTISVRSKIIPRNQ